MDDPEADPEDEEGNGSARRKQVRHLVLSKQNSHPSKLFPDISLKIFTGIQESCHVCWEYVQSANERGGWVNWN